MVQITNHFQRALSLLASQFRDQKPDGGLTNFQKLIKVFCSAAQELEDTKWQLKTERWLSTAVGVQLDGIGKILGLPRAPGESDEDYRQRLQFQVFINASNGTPEDQIAILSFFTEAQKVGYFQVGIGAFHLETDGKKFPSLPNDLVDGLFKASPAGINYPSITATWGVPIPFDTSGDLRDDPLYVAPNDLDINELHNLEMENYNSILYVSAGNVDSNVGEGGLDELGYPTQGTGQISELIQKNGNFPPRRF